MAEVDRLTIGIETSASEAVSQLNNLAAAFEALKSKSAGGLSSLSSVGKQLGSIADASNRISESGANRIKSLASALKSLQEVSGLKISSNVGNQLNSIATALSKMDSSGGQKLSAIANGLKPLTELGKSNLGSFIKQLSQLPDVVETLDSVDLDKFTDQIKRLTDSLEPLAKSMSTITSNAKSFSSSIQKVANGTNSLNKHSSKAAKGTSALGLAFSSLKLGGFVYLFNKAADAVAGWVDNANDYVENLNLFQVSMRGFYDEAMDYANLVNEKLGIDVSSWIRAQGTFMSIARGFGLLDQQAYKLSKSLTELSYDLSSLYNEDVDRSILRLQSAISGEIEPIRRLGISISQATLQEYALSLGIDESVTSMNEQEKALLRTLKIIESANNTGVIGDFARTLTTPANAMRVLQQQLTELARALGNLFLPAIVAIIPWVQAFVSLLTDAVRWIAALFGWELPEWNTSDWEQNNDSLAGSFGDVSDAVGDTTKKVKELKNATIGIDELNIISPPEQPTASGAGGAGGGPSWADQIEIPDVWDKGMLDGLRSQIEELKQKLLDLLPLIAGIGAGLLAWKLADKFLKNLSFLDKLLGSLMVAVGVTLLVDAIKDIIVNKKLTAKSIIEGGAGGGIAGAGIGFMLAKNAGLSWKGGMLSGFVIGTGIALQIMSVTAQLASGGISWDEVATGVVGAIISGAGIGGAVSWVTKASGAAAWGGNIALGAVISTGVQLVIMGVTSQFAEGSNWANQLLTSIGSSIAGAGLGFVLIGGMTGGLVGLGLGLAVSLALNVGISKIIRDQENLDSAIQEMKDTAIMTVEEATTVIGQWYQSWKPDNSIVLDLFEMKEGLDEEVLSTKTAYEELFSTIMADGQITAEELNKLTDATNNYFNAITSQSEANNDIIHEALVGALGRASGEGIQYYQDLIDKHNQWIATSQGTMGVLQQNVSSTQAALSQATPGTQEYTQALKDYNKAIQDLNQYVSAEKTASMQMYSEEIDKLKEAISSGDLDVSEYEAAQKKIAELGASMKEDIEKLDEYAANIKKSIRTEMVRAEQIGDDETLNLLGDIGAAIEKDIENQKDSIREAANGLMATLNSTFATSLETMYADGVDTNTLGTIATSYMEPILSSFAENAGSIIENSEELTKLPSKIVGTIIGAADTFQPTLDENGFANMDGSLQEIINHANSKVNALLDEYNVTENSNKFKDMLIVRPLNEMNIEESDLSGIQTNLETAVGAPIEEAGKTVGKGLDTGMENGINDNKQLVIDAVGNVGNDSIDALATATGTHSPSTKTYDIGKYMDEGLGNGIADNANLAIEPMSSVAQSMLTSFKTALEGDAGAEGFQQIGSTMSQEIATGLESNFPLIQAFFAPEKWMALYTPISNGLSTAWNTAVTKWNQDVQAWFQTSVEPWFSAEKWTEVARPISEGLGNSLNQFVSDWNTKMSTWWEEGVRPWFSADKWSAIATDAINGLKSGFTGIDQLGQQIGQKLIEGVRGAQALDSHSPSVAFQNIGKDAYAGFEQGFGNMAKVVEVVKQALSNMNLSVSAFSRNVNMSLTNLITELTRKIDAFFNDWRNKLNSAQIQQQSFTNNVAGMYASMASNSVSHINSIISALNRIPRSITTTHTIYEETVSRSSRSSSSAQGYATGGFPTEGQLFYAREKGPELVGTIGNKTAVANNEQIVESVSAGVYEAMLAVMSSGGNDNNVTVNVTLDGEQIYTNQQRVKLRRGYEIASNPNFSR